MGIAVLVEPAAAELPPVEYRWDADTDILSASLRPAATGKGMSGAVEIEGPDGSWLIFDVRGGRIAGVEVAVWPEVRQARALVPPVAAAPGALAIPSPVAESPVASVEVNMRIAAAADPSERTIHFRLGAARALRAVRVARDLIFEVDDSDRIGGVWLLNVPPFPTVP